MASPSLMSRDYPLRIFEKLDKNRDGLVSLDELQWLLETIGWVELTSEELESIVGKQSLDLDEFLSFYDSISKAKNENDDACDDEYIVKAFNVFDVNGDGYISSEELQNVLGRLGFWDETNGGDCRRMIRVYDTNLDGVLDLEEFKNMVLQVN